MSDIIPILGGKILDYVLVLHDCEGTETVTKPGGFFKIECGGGFLHLGGDFVLGFGAFSLEQGFYFIYINIVGFFVDFVAAGSLAPPDVIIHAGGFPFFEGAAMPYRVDFVEAVDECV